MNRTAILGLDLGQSSDRSAFTILNRKPRTYDPILERYGKEQYGPWDERWRCVSIRRWPQNTPYPEVIDYVLKAPFEADVGTIVIEYNGVGRPVADYLAQQAAQRNLGQLKIVPVLTSASNVRASVDTDPRGRFKVYTVPKVDMIGAEAILVQRGLLVFSSGVPEVKMLFEEMRLFRMKYTKAANVQFGNEPGAGKHDDIVMSYLLACWWAQRMRTFNFYAG